MEVLSLFLNVVAGIFAYTLSLYAATELILFDAEGGILKALIQGIEITFMRILLGFIPLGGILTFLAIMSQIKIVYRTNYFYAFLIALIASLMYEGLVYVILIPF